MELELASPGFKADLRRGGTRRMRRTRQPASQPASHRGDGSKLQFMFKLGLAVR